MSGYNLKIAEVFTKFPAGRFRTDGNYSGERFRDDFLFPALKKYSKVIVQLDGVRGYGSSFLEEAFGGLLRNGLISKKDLQAKLEIKYDDQSLSSYETEIWGYINDAQ